MVERFLMLLFNLLNICIWEALCLVDIGENLSIKLINHFAYRWHWVPLFLALLFIFIVKVGHYKTATAPRFLSREYISRNERRIFCQLMIYNKPRLQTLILARSFDLRAPRYFSIYWRSECCWMSPHSTSPLLLLTLISLDVLVWWWWKGHVSDWQHC